MYLQSDGFSKIRDYLDYKIFISVSWKDCKERLIDRRLASGRSLEGFEDQVNRVDSPNYILVLSTKDDNIDIEINN